MTSNICQTEKNVKKLTNFLSFAKMQLSRHVVDRHIDTTMYLQKSKFSAFIDVTWLLHVTKLYNDEWGYSFGRRVWYMKRFGWVVGYSRNGIPCYKVFLVVDKGGRIVTAFPCN